MPEALSSLYAWRCSVKDDDSIDPCGRFCGAGSHPAAFAILLMCPDVSFEHAVKEAIFTDCSAPRNLQPGDPFRQAFPNEKGVMILFLVLLSYLAYIEF